MRQFDMPQAELANANSKATNEMYSLDVLDLVRRKFWFITFFLLLGTALGVLYYFKAPKTFESSATIIVEEKNAPSASVEGDFMSESKVEKYLEILRSGAVLNPAITDGIFDEKETFKETKDILYKLARTDDHLIVKSADLKSDSGAIHVTFNGQIKDECQPILTSIVDSFEEYVKTKMDSDGGDSLTTLSANHDAAKDQLLKIQDELRTLDAKPHLRLRGADGNYMDPHQVQQSKLHEDLHEVRRERTKLQARIDTVKKAQARGDDVESMLLDVLSDIGENAFGAYVTTHREFVTLKVQEQALLSEFGSDHPELRKIRGQIRMVDDLRRQELNALRGGKRTEMSGTTGSDFATLFSDYVTSKIEVLMSEEEGIAKAIEAEQIASSEINKDILRYSELTRDRSHAENRFNETYDRLAEMQAMQRVSWRQINRINEPSNPEQASPSLPISVGGGFMLGALLGLLFAGLKEMAEKTFRSSDDVANLLTSRVIGHVNQFQKQRTRRNGKYPKVAPEVVALHQPSASTAEAYRAIRTAIFFNAQQLPSEFAGVPTKGGKIIQVTSPTPGDGKSTTISNLAASIAQSGRRVILVDCDFRKPVQQKLFGLSNDVGITSVIYGEAEWEDAIQEVVPGALSVLTCGPIPHNPAELLTSDYFSELLEDLREEYDFVLVDTPPLLVVTDPSIVSACVDLIYLVMRIRNGVRTNSIRAKEILEGMGVALDGVVINGLRRKDQKAYNYGGRYGYGNAGYGAYGGPSPKTNGKKVRNGRPKRIADEAVESRS